MAKIKVKYIGLYSQVLQTPGFTGKVDNGDIIRVDEKEYDSYFKKHRGWSKEKTKKEVLK